MRFGLLAVAGWIVAAVLTVAVSWSAVGVVRAAISPVPAVAADLPTPDETGSPSATATRPTPTATATPAVRTASLSGRGGSVTVRCSGGTPQFVNVTPNQGYTPRRDDSSAEVEFSSSAGRTEFTATCAGTVPRISFEEKGPRGGDDSGGGNSGRGGGNDD